MLGGQNTSIKINSPKSYITDYYYRLFFDIPELGNSANISSENSLNLKQFYRNLDIESLNSNLYQDFNNGELYTKFKSQLCDAKAKVLSSEELPPLYTLIGLKEGFTYADFRMAFRNYSLALHPDKNSDALKEEAGKLFNIFSIIQENIRKELN